MIWQRHVKKRIEKDNDQKTYSLNNTKKKTELNEPHQSQGGISWAPEGWADAALRVTPVVLLMLI